MPATTTSSTSLAVTGSADPLPPGKFAETLALRFLADVLPVHQDLTPAVPLAAAPSSTAGPAVLATWLLRDWAAPILALVPDLTDTALMLQEPLHLDNVCHEVAVRASLARSKSCRLAQRLLADAALPPASESVILAWSHSLTVTTFGVGAVAALNTTGKSGRWGTTFDAVDAARGALVAHQIRHLQDPLLASSAMGRDSRMLTRTIAKNLSRSALGIVRFILD